VTQDARRGIGRVGEIGAARADAVRTVGGVAQVGAILAGRRRRLPLDNAEVVEEELLPADLEAGDGAFDAQFAGVIA
jgi:hypothetical protein